MFQPYKSSPQKTLLLGYSLGLFPSKRNAQLCLTILDACLSRHCRALTQAAPRNSSRSNFSFHRQSGKANPFWSINLTLGCVLHFIPRWCFSVDIFLRCLPFSYVKTMFSTHLTLGQVFNKYIINEYHHHALGGKFMPIKFFMQSDLFAVHK